MESGNCGIVVICDSGKEKVITNNSDDITVQDRL